jgi:hypothetical protein
MDGMVGVVNPRLPKDLEQYRKNAASKDKASAPDLSGGGIVVVGGQVTITRTHSGTTTETETMVVMPSSSESGWHVNFGDVTSSLSGMSTGSVVMTTSLPVEGMVGSSPNSASATMSMGRPSVTGTLVLPSASSSRSTSPAGTAKTSPMTKPMMNPVTTAMATPSIAPTRTSIETKTSTGSQKSLSRKSIVACALVTIIWPLGAIFGW